MNREPKVRLKKVGQKFLKYKIFYIINIDFKNLKMFVHMSHIILLYVRISV